MRNEQIEKVKTAHGKIVNMGPDYHLGAVAGAFEEVDRLAGVLGVNRTWLHGRVEQYAALVWDNWPEQRMSELKLDGIGSDDLHALLESGHETILEWCEPWPSCGPEGNNLDAHVTLRASVRDCIDMQRRAAKENGLLVTGDDENFLLEFITIHGAHVVGNQNNRPTNS